MFDFNPSTTAQPRPSPAQLLQRSFDAYYREFLEITNRARDRFEKREWQAVLADAEERMDLYHHHLNLVEGWMRVLLGEAVHDYSLWDAMKAEFSNAYEDSYHADLALIFFYSVMRRLFEETGDSIEFSDDEIHDANKASMAENMANAIATHSVSSVEEITPSLVLRIVESFGFDAPFLEPDRDATFTAELLREVIPKILESKLFNRIEFLKQPFFRNKAAFLMGRIVADSRIVPMVFVLVNSKRGIFIDSVLTEEADLANVFTSARSNFHTDTSCYRETLAFLESIAPTRPRAYICSSIGFIHPGKLVLVKELRAHMAATGERFEVAPGVPGDVMAVFTLPTFRYVFKVIRDVSTKEHFRGRRHVVGQYWRVHRMDRVGRMLDSMTFHNLQFLRTDFQPEVLEELLRVAPGSVTTEGKHVVFQYVYAQRQIAPLDIFLANSHGDDEAKAAATFDYGVAIKDLAAAGIFVGNYLPENFGVNRLGRVILYDYDDLDDLVNRTFRERPQPPVWAERLPPDEWLSKLDNDVFPDQDIQVLSLPEHWRRMFLRHHADVLTPDFWNAVKAELVSGRVPDFRPYPPEKRLPSRVEYDESNHRRPIKGRL